jgi:hypothetical protein
VPHGEKREVTHSCQVNSASMNYEVHPKRAKFDYSANHVDVIKLEALIHDDPRGVFTARFKTIGGS